MKKTTLFLALAFAGFTITSQAQRNHYLKFTNTTENGGGILVIPNNPAINVDASQHKTITFRMMIPQGSPNNANWARIMKKNEFTGPGKGSYGISFGSGSGPEKNDLRIIVGTTEPVSYGNITNQAAPTITDGNWHHFTLVLNDNTDPARNPAQKSRLYIDGKLFSDAFSATKQTGPADMTNTADLVFGAASTANNVVKGMAIDDIRVWDRALTLTEINADRTAKINASTAPSLAGLLAAYDFEVEMPDGTPDITGKTVKAKILEPKIESNRIAIEKGSSNVVK